MNFIREGDLYSLICGSHLPAAKEFKRWIFKDVLLIIRKYDCYCSKEFLESCGNNPDVVKRKLSEMKSSRVIKYFENNIDKVEKIYSTDTSDL